MTPEISEFSYGFALTNELVGWMPVSAAPIFPSLIEEGRAGGGYDVRFDRPGMPMYLQFKRAERMVRATAAEISYHKLRLGLPFYRFKVAEYGKSDQHQMLLELDDGTNAVYYAAPRFDRLADINNAWRAKQVTSRSIFVKPSSIGDLDLDSHHVAYDMNNAFLLSDHPKELAWSTANGIVDALSGRIHRDKRTLEEAIPAFEDGLRSAASRADERIARKRGLTAVVSTLADRIDTPSAELPSIPIRSPRELSGARARLRNLADTAARVANAQLIIVQDRT